MIQLIALSGISALLPLAAFSEEDDIAGTPLFKPEPLGFEALERLKSGLVIPVAKLFKLKIERADGTLETINIMSLEREWNQFHWTTDISYLSGYRDNVAMYTTATEGVSVGLSFDTHTETLSFNILDREIDMKTHELDVDGGGVEISMPKVTSAKWHGRVALREQGELSGVASKSGKNPIVRVTYEASDISNP